MRGGAATAAAAAAAAGTFPLSAPEEGELAAAATPPPARSPNAAFPAPPPAFAMAPALEATAAAETAKALARFFVVVCFGEEVEFFSIVDVDRFERKKKQFLSLSYRKTVAVLYLISRRGCSPAGAAEREKEREGEEVEERAEGEGKQGSEKEEGEGGIDSEFVFILLSSLLDSAFFSIDRFLSGRAFPKFRPGSVLSLFGSGI